MTIYTKYRYMLAGGCLLLSAQLCAQDMNSPYSVYGIGNVDHRAYNRTSGIGHTGLALKSGAWLINNNPASIAGLEKSFYLFDLGLSGKSVKYTGDPIEAGARANRDFGARRAAFAVKITNNWASSIGFKQYSLVNYKYQGNLTVEGSSEKFGVDYEGDGGLNHFYWTNAISIKKNLLLGVNLGVISGSINRSEFMVDEGIDRVIETKVQDFYSKVRLEYGLLYSLPLNKKWQFSIGGRLATRTELSPERTVTVKENNTILVDQELVEANKFHLPFSYGVGIALKKNNSFTIAADYNAEQWKPLNIRGSGWSLVNSHRFSGGIELSRLVKVWDRPVEQRFFQIGGFIDNSYLSVKSRQVSEFGATLGFGSNFRNLLYNVSLELGQRGTISDGLIKENYFQVTIGLSYRDFLFSKGKKYN
jgi:hypothetical protein